MLRVRKKCLVLGVNGQDGSYAAERLLSKGYIVSGVGRQFASKWVSDRSDFSYFPLDLTNVTAFEDFLMRDRPDRIFHLAATHGSAGFSYEDNWAAAHLVNTMVTNAALEYLRRDNKDGLLVYLSSSKAFGVALPAFITEETPRNSTCIYSTTKNASTDLIRYYRQRHGLNASVIWTFNHDSPRRHGSFFIPQIVKILANSLMDPGYRGTIGSLKFWCDWGHAEEFMAILVEISEAARSDDYVLGTGLTVWAEDVVVELFSRYGLVAKNHVFERETSEAAFRSEPWKVDISHLQKQRGLKPTRSVQDVCDDILRLKYPEAWSIACSAR
jgi:GDPmannose 4,6-dehydratase